MEDHPPNRMSGIRSEEKEPKHSEMMLDSRTSHPVHPEAYQPADDPLSKQIGRAHV